MVTVVVTYFSGVVTSSASQVRDAALDTVVVTYFSGVVTSTASQVRDAALDTVVVTLNLFFQGSLQVLQVK